MKKFEHVKLWQQTENGGSLAEKDLIIGYWLNQPEHKPMSKFEEIDALKDENGNFFLLTELKDEKIKDLMISNQRKDYKIRNSIKSKLSSEEWQHLGIE